MDLENIMLSKVSQMEKVKNHMISLICGYKTKSNKQKNLTDTDNSMVVTRGKEGWGG